MRPDSFEYVIAVVVALIGAAVTFRSGAVVYHYARVRQHQTRPKRHGLLLWHIVTIAGSVSGTWLVITFGQLDIADLISTPRPVRLVGYALFGIATVIAIEIIGRVQHKRLRNAAQDARPTPRSTVPNPVTSLLARLSALWRLPDQITEMRSAIMAREDENYARLQSTVADVKTAWTSMQTENAQLREALRNADADAVRRVDEALAADSEHDADAIAAVDASLRELVPGQPVEVPADQPGE